jgi:hypothetical protein
MLKWNISTGFVERHGHGTGILVSLIPILTCSHSIVSRRFGKSRKDSTNDCLAKHLRFYIDHIDHSDDFHNGYEVESYFLPEEFKGQPKSAEHYDALLKLKPRVPCTKLMPLCLTYKELQCMQCGCSADLAIHCQCPKRR